MGCLRKRSLWCVLGVEGWELVAGQTKPLGPFPGSLGEPCLAPGMLCRGLGKEVQSSFLPDGVVLGSQQKGFMLLVETLQSTGEIQLL